MRLPRDVGVVIPAAGRGTRLGGAPKQFRLLADVPLLLWSIRQFASHPDVAQIVIALPADSLAALPAWLQSLASDSLRFVAGGATRHESVSAALSLLPSGCTVALVHDAARPFAQRDTIDAVIALARRGEVAIAALPLGDTLKRATAGAAAVAETIPRDNLWRAQTPQGFPRAVLAELHRTASAPDATDDATLAERAGRTVHLVTDSALNFKVTRAEDFALAEAWASHRK